MTTWIHNDDYRPSKGYQPPAVYPAWLRRTLPEPDRQAEKLDRVIELLEAIVEHEDIYVLRDGLWRRP